MAVGLVVRAKSAYIPRLRDSLWRNLAMAIVVLVALAPIRDFSAIFAHDEGVYQVQARQIAEDGTWPVHYFGESTDTELARFPYENTLVGNSGLFTYVRHPLYPILLSLTIHDWSPDWLPFATSMVGFLAALAAVWCLAKRLIPGKQMWAFWLAFASPLFFHAYILWAHAIAIALVGFGISMALDLSDPKRRKWPLFLGVALCVGLAGLLRTDAQIAGFCLSVVLILDSLRARRAASFILGSVVGAAAVGTVLLERIWVPIITGGDTSAYRPLVQPFTFVEGKILGFEILFFGATGSPSQQLKIASGGFAMLALAAGWILRRRVPGRAAWITALVAFLLTMIAVPLTERRGLLVSWPLAAVAFYGVCKIENNKFVVRAFAAIFAVSVIATQYAYSGGVDFGGRYLSLLLPLLIIGLAKIIADLHSSAKWNSLRLPVSLFVVLGFVLALSAVGQTVDNVPAHYYSESKPRNFVSLDSFPPGTAAAQYPTWKWAHVEPDAFAAYLKTRPKESFVLVAFDDSLKKVKPHIPTGLVKHRRSSINLIEFPAEAEG